MSKNIIIALVAVLLLGGGGAAYLLTQDRDDQTNNSSQSDSNTSTSEKKDGKSFNPKVTANMSFVATLSGKSDGVESLAGTIEADGKGNVHFTGTQAGEVAEYYLLADGSYIFCQDGSCFKTAASSENTTDDYTIKEEDVNKFRETATYLGEESCPGGTCDVWQVNDEGTDTKIYINKSDQYVSQVTGTQDGEEFKIVYEFKDVTITPPTDVQDISTLGQ